MSLKLFPELKTLLKIRNFLSDNKLLSDNAIQIKQQNIHDIKAPTNLGDKGVIIGALVVKLERPNNEDKYIVLSSFEKEVLIALSEGAEIQGIRDENGKIVQVNIYGNEKSEHISVETINSVFFEMLRKGLIDRDGELHYVISKVGRRIVQRIDEQSNVV